VNSEDRNADLGIDTRRLTLTRRSLLQNAAWLAAAASVPRVAWGAAEQDISPVMEKLSAYMAEARNRGYRPCRHFGAPVSTPTP